MKTFYEILKQSEPVKSIKMISKDRMTKSISLHKNVDETFDIIVDTESVAPTSVRGVKSSLARTKKIEGEDKALKLFDKKIAAAKKKGWKEK